MPFIEQWRRAAIDRHGLYSGVVAEIQPGDRCYVYYKRMMDKWKANPRWTTADQLFRDLREEVSVMHERDPDRCAAFLAWQVFFHLHVIPYELEKQKLNGDI